jgi:predicted nuclease with TOPRIM domain
MLLKKLKEEENLSEQIARETNTINSNLMQRTDDLKKLEYEHSAASRRLHQLNDELEALRG